MRFSEEYFDILPPAFTGILGASAPPITGCKKLNIIICFPMINLHICKSCSCNIKTMKEKITQFSLSDLGPSVQSIVILTKSLKHQLIMQTTLSNTGVCVGGGGGGLLFFVGKIFSTKNNSVFVIFALKIVTKC